jgi:hypothetical protein
MKLTDKLARRVAERAEAADERCHGDDGGYVLALTALLMLPLLAFTGFAVDLGAWYAEAAKIQRTADAAALAAVTYLPDEGDAQDAAEAILERNGYDPSQASYTPIGTQRYNVDIRQENIDQYFTSLFVEEVHVQRESTAEFIQEVALGSPRNYIGTYQLLSGALRENYVVSVNGPCSSREQGDLLLPITQRNFNTTNPPNGGGWAGCDGGPTTDSPTLDPDGYFYAVEIPEDYTSGAVNIRVYDGAHCESSPTPGYDTSGSDFTTTFTVYAGTNNPLDPTDNPQVANKTLNTNAQCGTSGTCGGSGNWKGTWCTLYQIPANQAIPGRKYFVQARSSMTHSNSTSQSGINSYSLAAYRGTGALSSTPGGTNSACSGDPLINPTSYSDQCVRVYAIRRLSLYTELNVGTTQPSFYLAEIGPEHSNKTLEVGLFDIGEGTVALEVLQPNGVPVTFDWEVINESGSDATPNGGWGGTTNNLDTRGVSSPDVCGRQGNMQASTGKSSGAKYNDRQLKLTIDLPADIEAAYGGQTWWRIRYTLCAGGAATDRTTWTAGVKGDPVRLVPN